MPWALSQMPQNTKENLDISCFGGDRAHASATFFHDFSVLGALWSTLLRSLLTLGRSLSSLGSSLAALGGHSVPKGSNRDPFHASTGREEGESNSVLEPYDH